MTEDQLQLLSVPDSVSDEVLAAREYQQGIYSGARLRETDPGRYDVVINLLADGTLSQRQISRLTGCSRNLISGISKSQTADIEPLKQRIAAKARNLAELCIERAEELVLSGAKLPLKDLMIAAGVMTDKSLLLSGDATQRIEVERIDPGEFNRRLQRLPDDQRARLLAMGFEGEIRPSKGAPIDADYNDITGADDAGAAELDDGGQCSAGADDGLKGGQ